MRKSYIATWLLLACSVVATLVIAIQIYATRDDVRLEETVVYGDSSKADGLTLDLLTVYNMKKFWKTSYTLGNHAVSQTDYGLFSSLSDEYKYTSRSFTGFYIGEDLNSFELFEDKYYTLDVSFDFPSEVTDIWEKFFDSTHEQSVRWTEYARLQHYFKIPVVKENEDDFNLYSHSALTDNMCYFTFDLHTEKGNLVDYSLLPDGFGIFAFPYEMGYLDENGDHVLGCNTAKLEVAYLLDPNTHIRGLDIDSTKKHLLLYTAEDENQFLTVIDIETMTEIQKLEIFADGTLSTFNLENAIVLVNYDSKEIAVISYGPNEAYELDFVSPLANEFYPRNFNQSICYNNGRLAFSDFQNSIWDSNSSYPSDIYVAIYEKTGLSYFGTYRSSLFSGKEMGTSSDIYTCNYYDFPTISW